MKRILFICSSWPHGRSFGGQIRALHLARALQQIGNITVLVVSSDAHDSEAMAKTAAEFDLLPPVLPAVCSDRGAPLLKLRRAFDTRYMNLHGFAASALDRTRVESCVDNFDLVWVLNSRTPNILQRWSWPRGHLDIDDVPSTYLRTMSQNSPRVAQRWKARIQQGLMRRREELLADRFTTLSVCSEADRVYLGKGDQVHVIPNGFQRPRLVPVRKLSTTEPRVGFIGLYSYAPNLDGVRWFLKECWPAIRQAVSGIRFRMIGRDTDGDLTPTEPAVDALGWLADPAAEIATWSTMIIPIRYGGGTRIKIAEAFSRKCPAVSTHVGAFGYDVSSGKELLLADKPEEFSHACIDLVRNSRRAAAMADRAWIEFLNKWTWDAITPKVWAAAEDCLRRNTTA